MLDTQDIVVMQRARGAAAARFALKSGRTRIADLSQSGSAKAMLPSVYGTMPHLVFVNTAGGITGGDRFDWTVEAGDGTAITATTQTAERLYRARQADLPGEVHTTLRVGTGARLDWVPQETILFEHSALSRRMTAHMAEDATLTVLEPIVIGRRAMGEHVARAAFRDTWHIHRGGRLVYADALRLPPEMRALDLPGALDGSRAFASLVHIAPDAETRVEGMRGLLDAPGVIGGVSGWNGMMAFRLVGETAQALRAALIPLLTHLRGEALPRVWHM
ncbi:urease accessory protein [Rubricella aquisinus]|uniref:Urease accessory protein UreD n=1 Tax=Rubricella aquisinus TaxID=2028108 RepID=A0A840X682_9RHOB|nr:urease accessory protein UreD [Rubricella aquisinus]MBB5516217.1 urease accessory protein [Rubricella aquisinus]